MRYTREEACKAWLAYGGVSAETYSELMEAYGSAEGIYDQFDKTGGKFLRDRRVSARTIRLLAEQHDQVQMHHMLLTMQSSEMRLVSIDEIRYPDRLRNIPDPPALLFYRGDLDCLLGKSIGVVGARKASPQGVEATEQICRELSDAGVTIISGLAVGIDAAAHTGCLRGPSPTAGVLACGIDVDYPGEHTRLKEQMLRQGGVLITECPPGTPASRYVFQTRNRIISGLSKALVVMECRIKSGSMITVQHALDQGKEVYAHPGTPGSEWAEGTHQLLREGAIYFTSARDILEDLGWAGDAPAPRSAQNQPLPPMDEKQRRVYVLLSGGEMSFDQLAEKSGLTAGELSAALTMLQIAGLIRALPGKCFSRI